MAGLRRWAWRTTAGIAVGLLAVAGVLLLRGGVEPGPEPRARGPDLRAAELLGCWRLRVGPWNVALEAGASGAEDPLAPPAVVQLLPDTGDEFARRLDTRRAVARGGDAEGRAPLRWLVRADTLWLVWSRSGVQAAAALFAEGDSLTGLARAVSDSLDGRAPAVAWPVNCANLARERPRAAPHR